MLPVFEQNAAYIWAIYVIGFIVPVGLTVFALMRARIAKRRLDRLQAEREQAS
ncbi:heme exporter protein CcmD [Henriciella marina]|uniref:heme exporter protein CcmD n=1 Tax=Henriciella marina TaxID=453851 RepID=UPI00035C9449|nr:heme exporter protein CcmD [Henriciella marina]